MIRDKIIEAARKALDDIAGKVGGCPGLTLLDYCDDTRCGCQETMVSALNAAFATIPGLSDVLDGKATIIPNKIGKEDAEGIWEAAYNVWAEFGASDAEAGQAAHDAAIHISPYRKEPDHGPV